MAEHSPSAPREEFEERLAEELMGAGRVFILGVGNEMRGDDAAGPRVIRLVKHLRSRAVRVVDSGVTPENFAEEILSFKPSHVVLIDAVEASQPPGFLALLPEDVISNVAVSTHRLPLTLLTSYLRSQGLNARFLFIGVQVRDTSMGSPPSPEVEEATRRLATALERTLSHLR
ncbi:MAG: hydrogenase 3 maturation endopeptidase HyCI [Candidatus Bathyarchaeia archaeon]